MWTTPALSQLEAAVSSPQNPIGMRMRAAYFLRQEYENYVKNNDDSEGEICKNVIDFLGMGLQNKEHGSLMRHEFAYVLGQLRDERVCIYDFSFVSRGGGRECCLCFAFFNLESLSILSLPPPLPKIKKSHNIY
mmetsp:Transcript_36235/g.47949  ORF Transcript_36235/g.47949 Transcript_36235/m.47949 type:complete len:134 (+) Transcript_36235:173-574(+)